MSIKNLFDARAKVVKLQEDLAKTVNERDGVWTDEERQTWDKANADFDRYTDDINRERELKAHKDVLEERVEEHVDKTQRSETAPKGVSLRSGQEYADKVYTYLRGGPMADEIRSYQAELDIQGGYAVLGEELMGGIIQAVDNLMPLRQVATVLQVPDATSLGVLSWDTDIGAPNATGEVGAITEDTAGRLGKRALTPHLETEYLTVSRQLLRMSRINLEGFLRSRLAYQFANKDDAGFMTGSGTSMACLGLFTASAAGISTSRDFSTDMATDNVTYLGLVGAQMNQKAQYRNRPTTRWIFSRGGIRRIRQILDGNGNAIWRQGLTLQQPDTILGNAYIESENASDTWTTGLYVGIYGDMSFYYIAEAPVEIRRLDELGALNNLVYLVANRYVDAMPVLEEAFTRVKLG